MSTTAEITTVPGGIVRARFLMADHDVVIDPATGADVAVTETPTVLAGGVLVIGRDVATLTAVAIVYPRDGFAQLADEVI